MVGFIKGLFGSKQTQEVPVEQVKAPVEPTQKANAFFLDADDAKTLGNIEYMRTAKTIRRTFPKTVSTGKSGEFIQSVSAMEMKREGKTASAPVAQPTVTPSAAAPAASETAERRRVDSSMDMFRNMAKDIKR